MRLYIVGVTLCSPQMAMFHVSTPWGICCVSSGGLQYCGREPQYSRTSSMKSVLLPFGHIVFNVIRDEIQLVHVSDDVFVVTGLPFKRESVLQCEFGDSDFEAAYDRRQIFRLGTELVRFRACNRARVRVRTVCDTGF